VVRKVKRQAILIQHKRLDALKGEVLVLVNLAQSQKTKMKDNSRSVIILCLTDKMLTDVMKKNVMMVMWILKCKEVLERP